MTTIHHKNRTLEENNVTTANSKNLKQILHNSSISYDAIIHVRPKSFSMTAYNTIINNDHSSFGICNSEESKSVQGVQAHILMVQGEVKNIRSQNNNFCIDNVIFHPNLYQESCNIKYLNNTVFPLQQDKFLEKERKIQDYDIEIKNTISKQILLISKFMKQAEQTINDLKDNYMLFLNLQNIYKKINIQTLIKNCQQLFKKNLQLEQETTKYSVKIKEYDSITRQQKEQIINLKRLIRQTVIQREQMNYQNYNLRKKIQQQHINSNEQITLLKTMIRKIRPVKSKIDLVRKNSLGNIKGQTRSEMQSSQKCSQDQNLLIGIDKSQITLKNNINGINLNQLKQQTIQNRRKQSISQTSSQFYFQIQKSDPALRLTVQKLRQKIQQLQFQLKIKDQTLDAINNFILQSSNDLNLKDKSKVIQILRQQEVKQKINVILKLAEQNAYLKKCMQKLSKSDIFWQRFQTPSEHKKQQNKYLLF